MKIPDEILDKALAAHAIEFATTASYAKAMRAALTAVLPDIEREIREECANVADALDTDEYSRFAGHAASAIRALPPSTKLETK